MIKFGSKLTTGWTKLGLHLISGPQEVTQLIGSTTDINPSAQCRLTIALTTIMKPKIATL